jgi:hypothetical protein
MEGNVVGIPVGGVGTLVGIELGDLVGHSVGENVGGDVVGDIVGAFSQHPMICKSRKS